MHQGIGQSKGTTATQIPRSYASRHAKHNPFAKAGCKAHVEAAPLTPDISRDSVTAVGDSRCISPDTTDCRRSPVSGKALPKPSTFSELILTPYQSVLTEEIIQNFQCMEDVLPALECELESLCFSLPPSSKKLLLLDLDETLLHTLNPALNYDSSGLALDSVQAVSMPAEDGTGDTELYVVLRPYARELLQTLSPIYQIVVTSLYIS
jgi:hypothetical protein